MNPPPQLSRSVLQILQVPKTGMMPQNKMVPQADVSAFVECGFSATASVRKCLPLLYSSFLPLTFSLSPSTISVQATLLSFYSLLTSSVQNINILFNRLKHYNLNYKKHIHCYWPLVIRTFLRQVNSLEIIFLSGDCILLVYPRSFSNTTQYNKT